ncbi:MAG: phosphoesterase [Lacipirellulaceae bacterium]
MPTVAEEQILVVPTSKFHNLGHFQGFSNDLDRYLPALLEGDDLSYRPRGEMEEDPSFKQLIPYVVFQFTNTDGVKQVFQYARGGSGGEKRLHAKRSVGVGGHISSDDASAASPQSNSADDVYREGMRRELEEEIDINTAYRETCVGLINDDETEVGKVHLGVVHLCEVDSPQVAQREEDLRDAGFKPVPELLAQIEQFESWSQIVLEALYQ